MRDEGGSVRASLERALVDAARALTPVVVDLGSNQPKLDAYLDRIEVREGVGIVRLAPIAADALSLAQDHVRVRPALESPGWELHARGIVAVGQAGAAIPLAGTRLLEVGDAEYEPHLACGDALVLVVPGGLDDEPSYVFPVCRLGTDVCEIRAVRPPEPGRRLGLVEIVGARRVLRRASADVLEVTPWRLADGSACFRCRLALGPARTEPARSYDLVTVANEVRRLLDFAGTAMASGVFDAPGWGRGNARFVEVGKDDATLDLSPVPRDDALPDGSVRLTVELLAVEYEMEVRVLERDGGRVRTSLPLILRRRRRHRRTHRTLVPEGERIDLVFVHPVTGVVETRPVVEASFYEVRFEVDPLRSVLWEALPLERASLSWRGRTIPLGDLVVQEVGLDHGYVGCTASIGESRVLDDSDMIELLASLAHPDVFVHDGANFDAMHATYVKADLFGPHMHRNLGPIVEQTRQVWHRLHAGGHKVVRTLVHGAPERPDAAVTVLRAWEQTWVAQHFVDVSPRFDGATGKLQTAYLDHVVPRPDGRFLVFFIKTDNGGMNGYLRRFFERIGTAEAASRTLVALWSHPGAEARAIPALEPGIELRALGREDEEVVERAAERVLGPNGASAMCMRAGRFELPETRAAFAELGLVRARECRVVWAGGERAWALCEEQATPGLNLTWMLNATWIVPIHEDADPDRRALAAALTHMLAEPAQSPSGERFLNVVEGVDPRPLEAAGFRKEADVYLYTLSRAGVHRFLEYAIDRYGELDAAVRRRAADAADRRSRASAVEPGASGERPQRGLG